MEMIAERLAHYAAGIHPAVLFLYIVALLAALGKGADLMVDEAVTLAESKGIPKMIIGATIVSLGTTTPETAVSVMAALQGDPGLALGNAVGSIIADTGLILGIACVIAPPFLDRSVVNRQGWIQVGAGVLLVVMAFLFGGRLPRGVGFLFLALLVAYIGFSIHWSKSASTGASAETGMSARPSGSALGTFFLLLLGIGIVLLTSRLLIPAVDQAARLFNVPEDIIAATLVALGTSMPELVTAITASLKRHGEVALGNVIGADILNVLFVTGAACAATPGGLAVGANFFQIHFPVMLLILVIFRIGIKVSKTHLSRPFGALMIGLYLAYLLLQARAL